MTPLLPELNDLPPGLILDGELVAWAEDGHPSFPLLSARMLHGQQGIAITYFVFDVLAVDRESTMALPFGERRRLLEDLHLNGPAWRTTHTFEDGEALFEAVCRSSLEGVVAKRLTQPYRPGERAWVKTKNRAYWRYAIEVEYAIRSGTK